MGVLVMAGSKGGTGKSLLTMLFAGVLARRGASFAVVDADPTRAAFLWAENNYEGPSFRAEYAADEKTLAHLIHKLIGEVDTVLVDTPGFENRSSGVAITGADYVLVPSKSSAADIREARETQDRIESLSMASRRPIPSRVVLTSMRTTNVGKHAEGQIVDLGLEPLKARLGHRAEYEALTHTGRIPHTGPAYREITALMAELAGLGWLP